MVAVVVVGVDVVAAAGVGVGMCGGCLRLFFAFLIACTFGGVISISIAFAIVVISRLCKWICTALLSHNPTVLT